MPDGVSVHRQLASKPLKNNARVALFR